MTKVISGQYKGRTLTVPKSVTRPTSSRVREAIFSALQHMLGSFENIDVLDLFAGSGALGIEAASRGASSVDFVEHDARAADVIRANLKTCKSSVGHVHTANATTYLQQAIPRETYDLVFMDPPYATSDADVVRLLDLLHDRSWLSPEAIIVIERDRRTQLVWPQTFQDLSIKAYGDTAIWYGRYMHVDTTQETGEL